MGISQETSNCGINMEFLQSLNEQLGTENIVEYYQQKYNHEFEGYKNAIKALQN